jgi:hypothetical protein
MRRSKLSDSINPISGRQAKSSSAEIHQMYPGAGRTGDRLVLVFGNIWIVIQLVLDAEAGRRAPENEMAHLSEFDGPATPDHDLAQGSP